MLSYKQISLMESTEVALAYLKKVKADIVSVHRGLKWDDHDGLFDRIHYRDTKGTEFVVLFEVKE